MGPECSERERERASDVGGQLGRVRAGCAGGPANRAARGSHRVGRARQGRPGKGEGEEGRAGWVGPEGDFLFFSNQMFIQFYFLHSHF